MALQLQHISDCLNRRATSFSKIRIYCMAVGVKLHFTSDSRCVLLSTVMRLITRGGLSFKIIPACGSLSEGSTDHFYQPANTQQIWMQGEALAAYEEMWADVALVRQAYQHRKWDCTSGRHIPSPRPAKLLAAESWPCLTSLGATFERGWHHFWELLLYESVWLLKLCLVRAATAAAAAASSPPQISQHLMNKKDVKFMCRH